MLSLQTSHLTIRDMQAEDIPAFIALQMNAQIRQYRLCFETEGIADWQARHMVFDNSYYEARERPRCAMSIFYRNSNDMIGDICINLDRNGITAGITYGLHPDFWGNGYMTEALKAVTNYAHNDVGVKIIREPVIAENIGSWRAMEKCGYRRLRDEMIDWNGKRTPIYIYQSGPR